MYESCKKLLAINFIFHGKNCRIATICLFGDHMGPLTQYAGNRAFLLLCRRCLPTSVFVGQTVRYNREVLSEGH